MKSSHISKEERSIAKSKGLGQKFPRYVYGHLDPVMPRLDKNGLIAGSAERCENITENRSAGAAWLSNAAWQCVCESGSKQISKSWVQDRPGEQKRRRA